MKNKISDKDLLELCLDDRFRAYKRFNLEVPKMKKWNIDLIGKILMVLYNSIGKNQAGSIIFIDEVQNGSMIGIMKNAVSHCKKPYSIMNFRETKVENHVKLGYIFPLSSIILTLLTQAYFMFLSVIVGVEKTNQRSSSQLISQMQKITARVYKLGVSEAYVMTDHNFYSTIFCNNPEIRTSVLQHGLIMDKSYYKVVLADRFCAWGNRSKELLDNDKRVEITGTYKFDGMSEKGKIISEKEKSLLFFVSDLDFDKVAEKLDRLLHIAEESGYHLKVKLHPGSFFKNTGLKEKFPDVDFFKEERIWNIDFSIGIIENSTVLIDLLYLSKPYIIFNENAGYFEPYPEIPLARSTEELLEILRNITKIDYSSFNKNILSDELNGGRCSIFG